MPAREASQMDLPFDLTLGGAIMLGLILIVGFSAWNTGNNLLFLILSFLAASMIVGFFAGSACLKKIDVRMRFPETIFAGEETPILVTLHNRKRVLPTFSVIAEVRGQERERSAVLDELQTIIPRRLAERLALAAGRAANSRLFRPRAAKFRGREQDQPYVRTPRPILDKGFRADHTLSFRFLPPPAAAARERGRTGSFSRTRGDRYRRGGPDARCRAAVRFKTRPRPGPARTSRLRAQ